MSDDSLKKSLLDPTTLFPLCLFPAWLHEGPAFLPHWPSAFPRKPSVAWPLTRWGQIHLPVLPFFSCNLRASVRLSIPPSLLGCLFKDYSVIQLWDEKAVHRHSAMETEQQMEI